MVVDTVLEAGLVISSQSRFETLAHLLYWPQNLEELIKRHTRELRGEELTGPDRRSNIAPPIGSLSVSCWPPTSQGLEEQRTKRCPLSCKPRSCSSSSQYLLKPIITGVSRSPRRSSCFVSLANFSLPG